MGLALGMLLAASPAGAEDVVVLMHPDAGWATSLRVELAARDALIVPSEAPAGRTAEARAREAEQTASSHGALAAVWLEREDGVTVRAIAAGSEVAVWAPVPSASIEARVFALVAASLLDELAASREAPAAAPLEITVCRTLPTFEAAAGLAAPDEIVASPPAIGQRGVFFELHGTVALVSFGGGLGVGFFADDLVTFTLRAQAFWVLFAEEAAGSITGTVAYVSAANDGRFETGIEAGVARWPVLDFARLAITGLAQTYFGWSWGPAREMRLGIRLGAGVVIHEDDLFPTGLLSFYAQVFP